MRFSAADLERARAHSSTITGQELFQNKRVSAATFAAARDRLGVCGITELTATFGYNAMLVCTLNDVEVEPEPDAEVKAERLPWVP